jgi:hypothetical protein
MVRNGQGREIWFARVLGSYLPIHWKGWAILSALIISVSALVSLTMQIGQALGYREWSEPGAFAWIVPGLVISWIITERHCPDLKEQIR